MLPGSACSRYNLWVHTCWSPPLSYWSGRRLLFLTAGQLLGPVRGVVHHEVLSPHNAQSPFPPTSPPSHSAKTDVLLNTNIISCHDLPLRKFPILLFCLFILCTAVQLKVWYFTTPMWLTNVWLSAIKYCAFNFLVFFLYSSQELK